MAMARNIRLRQDSRLALGVIPSEFDPSWGGKTKEAPLRS